MEDETVPRLTAEEFWEQWQTHVGDKPVLATFMEFAEAYAKETHFELRDKIDKLLSELSDQDALLGRAAELLLSNISAREQNWYNERDQWLDDSGIGKFSKEAIKAAMDDDEDAGVEEK
jgi:hypothetical protein